MADLFQYCPHHDTRKSPTGACAFCGGVKFVQVGVTTGQLERMVDLERVLAGDPGVPPLTRDRILRRLGRRLRDIGVPWAPAAVEQGLRHNPEIEAAAKRLYDNWSEKPGWVPWVPHGNSEMQDKARSSVAVTARPAS